MQTKKTEMWHVHRVAQAQETTIENVLKKYEGRIHNHFIHVSELKKTNESVIIKQDKP